ncbi:hypothetical protein [Coleofasciculus sp. H7-2]|uniref:hypothetical protein n=1 Tax=Coleofasciculus sp. H7-2 TaxID=3351545 RepID=UPI0036710513
MKSLYRSSTPDGKKLVPCLTQDLRKAYTYSVFSGSIPLSLPVADVVMCGESCLTQDQVVRFFVGANYHQSHLL